MSLRLLRSGVIDHVPWLVSILVGRQREEHGRASYATGCQRSLQERGPSTMSPLRGNAESRGPTFFPGV
jgi:hypothetical protein